VGPLHAAIDIFCRATFPGFWFDVKKRCIASTYTMYPPAFFNLSGVWKVPGLSSYFAHQIDALHSLSIRGCLLECNYFYIWLISLHPLLNFSFNCCVPALCTNCYECSLWFHRHGIGKLQIYTRFAYYFFL
jgi:hypothetical protein